MQGVVLEAVAGIDRVDAFSEVHRGAPGDARGSSANSLKAEFLGDYNYAFATNAGAVEVWNDVRQAADCPAVDAYRQALVDSLRSGRIGVQEPDNRDAASEATPADLKPAPNVQCPTADDAAFGNSDIWSYSSLR